MNEASTIQERRVQGASVYHGRKRQAPPIGCPRFHEEQRALEPPPVISAKPQAVQQRGPVRVRRNFAHERVYERELEQQQREALRLERERAEEMRRRQLITEQEWRSQGWWQRQSAVAQQMRLQHHPAAILPRHGLL